MRALNVEPQGEVGAALAGRARGPVEDVWAVLTGAASRGVIGTAAETLGAGPVCGLNAKIFSPDKAPANPSQGGIGEGT